jgi:hypothetical protein
LHRKLGNKDYAITEETMALGRYILMNFPAIDFSLDLNTFLVVFMVIRCTYQVMYFVNLNSKGLALSMQYISNSDMKEGSIAS